MQVDLGLLDDLLGKWVGKGFTLTAYPDRENNTPFELEVHGTSETLDFTNISDDADLSLCGLNYQHRVVDCALNAAIHLEAGVWSRVPVHGMPPIAEIYARQIRTPSIIAMTAQSTFFTTIAGAPEIAPVYSTPFTGQIPGLNEAPATPVTDPDILKLYVEMALPTECLPPGLDAAATIWDPTHVLHAVLDRQKIRKTTIIKISTPEHHDDEAVVHLQAVAHDATKQEGVEDIDDFVVGRVARLRVGQDLGPAPRIIAPITIAPVALMDAIFWIEDVILPLSPKTPYIQLQYVQRVVLDFGDIYWPHISVGTLVKMPQSLQDWYMSSH